MIAEEKTYASESHHFYHRDGTPCYEVENKSKGGMRPTTVRDAKKLGLLPSVSTILGIVSKPGLSGWMKEQVAKAAFGIPPQELEGEEEWVQYVLERAETNMNRARDLGTEIHGAIEEYFWDLTLISDWHDCYPASVRPHSLHIKAAVEALKEFGVWGEPFRAEKSFASPLGYGGKVDLSGSKNPWIVDFKGVDRLDKKLDYPDRCQQLVAYADGLYGLPTATRVANIFICTSEPGTYKIREWDEEEKSRGYLVFRAAFNLWCESHNYYP